MSDEEQTPVQKKRRFYDEIPIEDQMADEARPVYHRGKLFALGATGVLLIIIVFALFSCGPRKGTILYGICKTYLEQDIAYPETIRPVRVEQFPSATRIYYTSIDPFGQYKLEYIECVYKFDAQNNLSVDKVLVNRREEDQDKIDSFNKSLAAIVAGKPDLTLPPPLPDIEQLLKNARN